MQNRNVPKHSFSKILRSTECVLLLFIVLFCIAVSLRTPNFLTAYNIRTVARQISFTGIVALGQTLVLLTGGIDLSVSSMAGFNGILASKLMVEAGINPYVAILMGILSGAIIGLFSGLLVTKIKMIPFIATLAIQCIFYGAILVITEGFTISGIPQSITWLGQGKLGIIPIPTLIFLILALILGFLLNETAYGRHIYAIGGNEAAAKLLGIRVDTIKASVYVVCGALSSFAGILLCLRYGSGQPTVGQTWVNPSISAGVLGGVSMTGGKGTILGAVLGATLMGILSNAIVLLDISAYWEQVITGIVMLIAVMVDLLRNRRLKV